MERFGDPEVRVRAHARFAIHRERDDAGDVRLEREGHQIEHQLEMLGDVVGRADRRIRDVQRGGVLLRRHLHPPLDAKVKTRDLVEAYELTGELDRREPVLRDGRLSFFAAQGAANATSLLKALFDQLRPEGYVVFLAYIERSDAHEAALSAMRTAVRDARRVATVVGFGPRFLHSTGQAYKGGPAGGVFIEITQRPSPILLFPATGRALEPSNSPGDWRPGRARRAAARLAAHSH